MLVLKRKEDEWVEIRHKSGDVLMFRVYEIIGGMPGRVCLAFQDDAHNFAIHRSDRRGVTTARPGQR